MSEEIKQFMQIVSQTYAWLLKNTTLRQCQVCDSETKQVIGHLSGWTQYRCVDCGFQESVQEVSQETKP